MIELKESLNSKNTILFVGAGVSMNLGLPSWDNLIDYIAKELGYDPDVFKSFGDYLSLAEFYKIKSGKMSKLTCWMDEVWDKDSIKIGESEIHRLIVELDVPLIYTTNYDRWIERSYDYYGKAYKKITNVTDLVNLEQGKTQIVKFHGDFDDSHSIVLTEDSYFERLGFETPLDIKLRSDMLSKSILFIGYSLSDINLRYLFYKLNKLWDNSKQSLIRPKSYIFLTRTNPVEKEILESRGIKVVISEHDDPGEGLLAFLKELKDSKNN